MKNPLHFDATLRAEFFAGLKRLTGIGYPCPFNCGGELELLTKFEDGTPIQHKIGERTYQAVACNLNPYFHHWEPASMAGVMRYKISSYQRAIENARRQKGVVHVGRKGNR